MIDVHRGFVAIHWSEEALQQQSEIGSFHDVGH